MDADKRNIDNFRSTSGATISEDPSQLIVMGQKDHGIDMNLILESLRRDLVVLVRDITPERADDTLYEVAVKLGLGDKLKLQAGFATFLGHRQNIGKFFMSVNQRDEYQFISPHSEGSSFSGMQLASFFCFENSTDGGETILMNVDDSSSTWQFLREKITKIGPGSKTLGPRDAARAKALYRLQSTTLSLDHDDQILKERRSDIPGLKLVEVLARPQKVHSCIADRKLHVYWDTVASIDFDSLLQYARMLRECGLLREPEGGLSISQMDTSAGARVWSSGIRYPELFKCKITLKLQPGDLIIQNNMTWAHAAANWCPNSGSRRIAAAFA